jgi:hypothetical protein
MAEYLVRDLKLGLSTTPESSYNSIKVLGSQFLGFEMTGTGLLVPDVEKFDDTGKIGAGHEFPTEQRSGYVLPATMSISDELNTDIAAILARRALGGTDLSSPTVVEADVAWGHDFSMKDNTVSRQLPSSSLVYSLGGADFVWGGCVVDKFGIAQTRSGNPTFTADLIASGINKRIRDISPSFGTVPAPVKQNYMYGAETALQFTDEGGTPLYVVTSDQRLKAVNIQLDNAHITDDRRPGDPRVLATDMHKGWYVNRMLHGDRKVTADFTVTHDDTMREYFNAVNDSVITGFIYTAKGYYIGASTTHQYQFQITVPKCYFRTPKLQANGPDAEMNISIFPVEGSSFGLITVQVQNDVATTIV